MSSDLKPGVEAFDIRRRCLANCEFSLSLETVDEIFPYLPLYIDLFMPDDEFLPLLGLGTA